MLRNSVIILICAFFAGALRELLELSFQSPFHWVTLVINLTGALLMGMTYEYVELSEENSGIFSLIVGTGLIGSFTTFSTFISEIYAFIRQQQFLLALLYLVSSTVFGILLLISGKKIVRVMKHAD
ncbi:fluoride efflux transporter FluC [Oenococcus kitaharae]|uniref:fluoride efflux transporter FluC n=1 Tax=Oenococcus TaxID=46254 RepID=UPI0021E72BE7|nr:CrcB family protein [Oenococcus kitaharae]MCV3295647.1 CrcB family protein [Oenococcus kitaharae]